MRNFSVVFNPLRFSKAHKKSANLPLKPVIFQKITLIACGHILYAGFNWFFDHIVYVYVVYTWGIFLGGSLMTLASLLQCALTLVVYEKMRIDWVGISALNTWQAQTTTTWALRIFKQLSKRPRAIFIFLSVYTDPFITIAYFRQGQFDELTLHDWQIFLCSVLLSNFYWIGVSVLLSNGVVQLWHWYLSTVSLIP